MLSILPLQALQKTPLKTYGVFFAGEQPQASSSTVKQTTPPLPPEPGIMKRGLKSALRLAINLFFVGSAAFTLVGLPILAMHLPILAVIGIPLGLGIVGHFLRKKFPDAEALNVNQMKAFNQKAISKFQKGVDWAEKLFDWVTWMPGRKLYRQVTGAIVQLTKRSMDYIVENMVTQGVKSIEMPKGSWPKVLFVAKISVVALLEAMTVKLGALRFLANGLISILQLQDIQKIMEPGSSPPSASDSTKDASDDASGLQQEKKSSAQTANKH